MNFTAVGTVTLHYAHEGLIEGVPLVFINSLGSDLRLWDQLVPYFVDRFPIIRYDKRGHGLSDCPPGPYTIRDHANDLAGLLSYLKVEQAVLVGISVGGLIALDFALNNPQKISALVLCDTGAKLGTAAYWNERIEAIRKSGLVAMAEMILGRWFRESFSTTHPVEYRGYYNLLSRMPAAGYIATCEAIRDADLREAVGKITVKSLVLCGAQDLATPPELGRDLVDRLNEARFELIEEAAHLPCIEQPEAVAAKINQFLRENGYV